MNKAITLIIIGIIMLSTGLTARNNNPQTPVKQKQRSLSRLESFQNMNGKNAHAGNASNQRTSSGTASLYDSVYFWNYNAVSDVWDTVANQRYKSFVYDGNNNLLNYIIQTWDTSHFVNSAEVVYTYDGNHNKLSLSYLLWNDSDFVNSSKHTYTYNGNNSKLTDLYQLWNGTAFANYGEDYYSYNSNNEETVDLFKFWNDSEYVNLTEDTLMYNNNNLSIDLSLQWNDSVFVNSAEDIYAYDLHNNQIADTAKTWNDSTSTFDLSGLTIDTYDANNNLLSSLNKSWEDSVFVNLYGYHSTYNSNNAMLSNVTVSYDSTGLNIASGDSVYFYYQGVAGINELSAGNGIIYVYPNPANGLLAISNNGNNGLTFSNNNINVAEIYDMMGEKVRESTINDQDPLIDVSSLSPGIYFIQVMNESRRWVGKFVKE